MSSPARLSASAASVAGSGGGAASAEENTTIHQLVHVTTANERKEEALLFLKSEVMEQLDEAVRSLDDDSWMFARPRSRIHLLSKPGSHPIGRLDTAKNSALSTDKGFSQSNFDGLQNQPLRFTSTSERPI